MNKDTPVLIGALTCDQVITDKTVKHTLVGLFSNIYTGAFPAIHPRMTLFCAWLNREKDEKYKLKIFITAPQKNELAKIEGEIEFKKDKSITYGIFNFNGVTFKEEGTHLFEVYLDEKKVVEVPIKIEKTNINIESSSTLN